MDASTIHILTFTSQNPLNDKVKDLTTLPVQDTLGIWVGECFEDPELTLLVIAGFPDGLDSQSFLDLTPKRQQRTEMPMSALVECLEAPVTEVATMVLKDGCDHIQAVSLIDTAMSTVQGAEGFISAVWKTIGKEAVFFVGWGFLEAHEKYHQKILADPPDWIKQLPNIVDTNVVLHLVFRRAVESVTNKMS